MDVYALDSDFNLVMAGIPYDNLQWSRRYYEAGDFEMQIPLSAYDKSWAYIGSPQWEWFSAYIRATTTLTRC